MTEFYVSEERQKEYDKIVEKHLTAFAMDLKEHGFCPIPAYIGCNKLYELDYIKQLDLLKQ